MLHRENKWLPNVPIVVILDVIEEDGWWVKVHTRARMDVTRWMPLSEAGELHGLIRQWWFENHANSTKSPLFGCLCDDCYG